jgi:hypothetical protein
MAALLIKPELHEHDRRVPLSTAAELAGHGATAWSEIIVQLIAF